ncbi:MAG: phosphotransferase, partial [Oscillospiraceae bacterium]|nr:phosphotransferase [Oscillospiraceae bacterium]
MSLIDLTPIKKSETFCDRFAIRPGDDIDFELMGHGEYNLNYLFRHPATGDRLVLRIPVGSQMHLSNQIRYEFEALRMLEQTGRVPKPLYIDDSLVVIPHGFLVMDFLPGRALRYESDLVHAAQCLAGVHNIKAPAKNHLLAPQKPIDAILDECQTMARHYLDSDLAVPDIKHLISSLLKQGQKVAD